MQGLEPISGSAVPKGRIRPAKLAEAIADHLESLILEGSLRPGDRLLAERELAQKLDVSRPSLREALGLIEGKGLLHSGRGGSFVAPVLGEDFSAPLVALLAGRPESTYDYLEFRSFVEGAATYYAALRASDVDRELMHKRFLAIEAAHRDRRPQDEAAADAAFHLSVYEATHNVMILHVMGSLAGLLRQDVFYNRERLYARKGVRALLLAQHRAVHDAVMRSDPEAARAAAEDHVMFTRTALREIEQADDRLAQSLQRLATGRGTDGASPAPAATAAPQLGPTEARQPNREPLAVPLASLLKAHPETAFDYLEFRFIVAGTAAQMAALRADQDDRQRMAEAFEALASAHGTDDDPTEEAEADAQFHLAVYRASHNAVMEHVMRNIFNLLRNDVFYDRHRFYRREGVRALLLRQHKAIHDAVISGDAAAARQAAERHMLYAREALQEIRLADQRREVALRRVGRDSLAQVADRNDP